MRTMHAKHPALRAHSSEVGQLAVAVARRLGMTPEEIDEVARAAELHDVGKVGIPDAILDSQAHWSPRNGSSCGNTRSSASASSPPPRLCARWRGSSGPVTSAGMARAIRSAARDRDPPRVTHRGGLRRLRGDDLRPAVSPGDTACAELSATARAQFDPEGVESFLREINGRPGSRAEAGTDITPPLQALADHVRSLLAQPTAG